MLTSVSTLFVVVGFDKVVGQMIAIIEALQPIVLSFLLKTYSMVVPGPAPSSRSTLFIMLFARFMGAVGSLTSR